MNRTPPPAWLTQHLTNLGLANPDHIHRRATTSTCRGCRRLVVRGLDDDRCGLPVTCDPTPLTPAGELAALLAGVTTYDLTHINQQLRLDHRAPWHITAGHQPRRDVIATHRCDHLWPPTQRCGSRIVASTSTAVTAACPF